MKNNKSYYDQVYKAYCNKGQSSAFDVADKHNLPFEYCNGCETETPATIKHTCIICGQKTEPELFFEFSSPYQPKN